MFKSTVEQDRVHDVAPILRVYYLYLWHMVWVDDEVALNIAQPEAGRCLAAGWD